MHDVMLLSNNRCRDRGNFSLELIKKRRKEKHEIVLPRRNPVSPFIFFLFFFFKNRKINRVRVEDLSLFCFSFKFIRSFDIILTSFDCYGNRIEVASCRLENGLENQTL